MFTRLRVILALLIQYYGNSGWGWDLEKIEEVCGGGSPAKSPAPSWEVCQFSRCAVSGAEDWGGCNQRQQVINPRMQCIVRNDQLFSWIRVSCCQIWIIVPAFCWMDQWNWKIYVSPKNTRLFTGKKVGNAKIFKEAWFNFLPIYGNCNLVF